MSRDENMVMGHIARAELGKPGKPISNSRYSAIKRAMKITSRYVLVSDMRRFLRDHPNFSETQIYTRSRDRAKKSRRSTRSGPPAAVSHTNGQPS